MIRAEFYIQCDLCGWAEMGTASHKQSVARKESVRQGWVRRKVEGKIKDICPQCQQAGRVEAIK